MKKVLFVINSLAIGGSEKSLVSLLSLIDYKKYNVDLLMFRHGGEFEKYIPKEVNILSELEYYSYLGEEENNTNITSRIKYLFYRIKTSINLRKNLKRITPMHSEQILYKSHKTCLNSISEKYDIAIAYSQGVPTYYVAEKVNSDKKIAWINCDYATTMYDKEYDKSFYAKFHKIIVVSNSIRESIAKLDKMYKRRLEVIFDIVDPKLIERMAGEEKVLQDKSYINILTVARLVIDHKGYDLAIEAAKLLKINAYNFKWFVIGDGPDKNKINQLILKNNLKENFILLGKKDNPYPYMKNCDIYVQPSKKEGFGLTVVEAKILKKPILCTNFNTAKEIIKNEYDGLIVEQSAKDIYLGLKRYIDNSGIYKRISDNLNNDKTYNSVKEIKKIENIILKN